MDEKNPEVRFGELLDITHNNKLFIWIFSSNNLNKLFYDFSFLELPWDDSVMHHEQQINKKGGISLSKVQSFIC